MGSHISGTWLKKKEKKDEISWGLTERGTVAMFYDYRDKLANFIDEEGASVTKPKGWGASL